jgi:hypothetical protein
LGPERRSVEDSWRARSGLTSRGRVIVLWMFVEEDALVRIDDSGP